MLASFASLVHVAPRIRQALALKKPIVALESTILSHGGFTAQMASAVEDVVRGEGAEPATIGLVGGRIKVGLDPDDLAAMTAKAHEKIKVSRRDLVSCLSTGKMGGTTVSGTLAIMKLVGLNLLATGGIGGVHRDRKGQDSMDCSADLYELATDHTVVVSAGIKSILDIPRTLERLESLGVTVLVLDPFDARMPAFYSPSEVKAPLHVQSIEQVAEMIRIAQALPLRSGMLVGVHPPKDFVEGGAGRVIQNAVQVALTELESTDVVGKDITPWLLARVDRLTKGVALDCNFALMKNNAKIASQIAVSVADGRRTSTLPASVSVKPSAVVIGAAVLDIVASPQGPLSAGSTSSGKVNFFPGGVGRNIAEACARAGVRTAFVSILGRDAAGGILSESLSIPSLSTEHVQAMEGTSATCSMFMVDNVMDRGLVDTALTDLMDPDRVKLALQKIGANIIAMDGNMPLSVMEVVIDHALQYSTPILYEPTSVAKASKILSFLPDPRLTELLIITPNLLELTRMTDASTRTELKLSARHAISEEFNEVANALAFLPDVMKMTLQMSLHAKHIIVKLGSHGILLQLATHESQMISRYLPAKKVDRKVVQNSNGCGDTFSGILLAQLSDKLRSKELASLSIKEWLEMIEKGQAAAAKTLQSELAVWPGDFSRL